MECSERCLSWPCPDFACMPCLTGFQTHQFKRYLEMADEVFFTETGARFNGDQCYITIRPCVRCSCRGSCSCDPCQIEVIDLWKTCGIKNVCEIVDITINDEWCTMDEGWEIIKGRYLRCPPTGWPSQDISWPLGKDCTWSITLRYGKKPPAYLTELRDQWLWDKLAKKFSPQSICDTDREVQSVSQKGVTYFKARFDPLKEAKAMYPCRKKNKGGYWPTRDRMFIRNATAVVVESWVGERCDLDQGIKNWIEGGASNIQYTTIEDDCLDSPELNEFGLHG